MPPGRQLTNFKTDRIRSFRRSPDGKSTGVFYERVEGDVVLLREASRQKERALLVGEEGRPQATSEFQSAGRVILTTCPIPTGGGPKPQLET